MENSVRNTRFKNNCEVGVHVVAKTFYIFLKSILCYWLYFYYFIERLENTSSFSGILTSRMTWLDHLLVSLKPCLKFRIWTLIERIWRHQLGQVFAEPTWILRFLLKIGRF